VITDDLLRRPQYSLEQPEKEALLVAELMRLTEHHRRNSTQYDRLLRAVPPGEITRLNQVPFLPVGLFKSHRLISIPERDVFKTLTSSGTTGQQVSRIVLDRDTAARQTQALAAIMTHVLGPTRLPMIIVDTPSVVKDRKTFSARGAGVLGMLTYGRNHFYALDEEMQLDRVGLQAFLKKYCDDTILLFGFTFMVWKYFFQQIRESGLDLSRGVLVHSGGWKGLADEAVDNREFRRAFAAATGLTRVHNFYGMVEQVGSVSIEGDDGYLHTPNFAEVIIRDPVTWQEAPTGSVGVIQVVSVLPTSYPGHSILTEDLGAVRGIGTPSGGWGGKQLEVVGRIPKAELRGCSDTHAAEA
jgi:hypothetical protein